MVTDSAHRLPRRSSSSTRAGTMGLPSSRVVRIAAYILSDYDKAAFMTASKLGKLVGVSESTVVRFAAMLGYDGYPAMQRALQELVRSKLTSIQRIQTSNDRLFSSDVVSSVLQMDMEKIRIAIEEVDRTAFTAVVDKLMAAKHIYIGPAGPRRPGSTGGT